MLTLSGCRVDLDRGDVVHADGRRESLTTMERRALAWLVARPGEEISHDTLLAEVWGYAQGVQSRAPYFTLRRVRAKIERDPEAPEHLLTVHGTGYRFVGESAAPRAAAVAARADAPAPARVAAPAALVGRDALIEKVQASLSTSGWVGLYGPPGVGATAVARAVAAAWSSDAWWCDAAAAGDDAAALARLVATTLGRRPDPADTGDPAAAVAEMLGGRRDPLLVLDAVGGAVTLVRAWLAAAPMLRVVSTHRQRPPADLPLRVTPLADDAGAALLRRAAAPDEIEVSEDDLRALSRRLDGLPLALCVVGPRLRLVAPARMLQRAVGPERLAAALDDAIRALGDDTDARAALAACVAFPAGADLDRLVAVSGLDEGRAIDALQGLCDRSLVQVRTGVGDEPLFELLSSVRAAALRTLGSGPETAEVFARQPAVAAAWGARMRRRRDDGDPDAHAALVRDAENLRRAAEYPPAEVAARLALHAALMAGHTPQERWQNADLAVLAAERTAASSPEAAMALAEALHLRGMAVLDTGQSPADDLARATAIAAGSGHPDARALCARVAITNAEAALRRGSPRDADGPVAAARALAESVGQPALLEAALQAALHCALDHGDVPRADTIARDLIGVRVAYGLDRLPARNLPVWASFIDDTASMVAMLESDLQLYRRRGERQQEANTLMNLGYAAMNRAEPGGLALLRRSAEISREVGNRRIEAMARFNLAYCYLLDELLLEARAEALAARTLSADIHHVRQEILAEIALGHIAVVSDRAVAAPHFERASALAENAGLTWFHQRAQRLGAFCRRDDAAWEAACAAAPDDAEGRILRAIYEARPDLDAVFATLLPADQRFYRRWVSP
jgi:DNA-binding winged helix-turn-helix (wHTH) protein